MQMKNPKTLAAIFVILFLVTLYFLFVGYAAANDGSLLQALINNLNISDSFFGHQQDNDTLTSNTPAPLMIVTNTLSATSTPTHWITITKTGTHTPTPTATTTPTHTTTNTAALTATITQVYYTIATFTPHGSHSPTNTAVVTPTASHTPTNTPTPTPTQPADTILGISISGQTDCYQVEFDVTVQNTAERSTATDVVGQLMVIKGFQYVTALTPTTLIFGDIAPGASKNLTAIMILNDAWLDASGKKRIQVSAIVVQETSRPDHTVGVSDTATITHPGNCLP
jgi:hypothetical protein